MAISEAKRKSNNDWDKKNMSTLACKVRKTVADAFKAKCTANGTTANSVLQSCVSGYINGIASADAPSIQPVGIVSADTLAEIDAHIKSTDESAEDFITRAVADTVQRDKTLLSMGIRPAKKKDS